MSGDEIDFEGVKMSKRRVCVVTGSRADYCPLLPVLRGILSDDTLELELLVTGSHLSGFFGNTVDEIVSDGIPIAARLPILDDSRSEAVATSESMGKALTSVGAYFADSRPDLLLVLGDRYEAFCAVAAALAHTVPVAHLHGGELTIGLIDDALRHAMTKMSHFHFAATKVYADRIVQLGEDPSRVFLTGAPQLDLLPTTEFLSLAELENLLGISLPEAPLLVTYHPVTLECQDTRSHILNLLTALESVPAPIVFTKPNADTGFRIISERLEEFCRRHENAYLVDNLGSQAYLSFMNVSSALVGNSSSGIVEAGSFSLPVLNVGSRQEGRIRGANIVDVGSSLDDISRGLTQVLDPSFRESLTGMENPYGDGKAAPRIIKELREQSLSPDLLKKKFYDR